MARKRRKSPKNAGLLANRSHSRLTQTQRELVVQAHAACGSIAATARELGISEITIRRVVREADTDTSLQVARGRALQELAGKAHAQAERVLDAISDEELTYERAETYDQYGNFKGFAEAGAGIVEKARAFGIFADKISLLQQARAATLSPDPQNPSEAGLLLPQTVEDAKRMIAQKVRRLRIVDMEFDQGETGERVRELTRRANLSNTDVEDADYVPFGAGADPFD